MRNRVPVNQRRVAYLVYNECLSSDHSTERSRWDIYTVSNGQRDYHHTGVRLAVAVAFAAGYGLRIKNEDGELGQVWEVEDERNRRRQVWEVEDDAPVWEDDAAAA